MAQADTDVPASQGVQAWDRFAYANNNPILNCDPTGHEIPVPTTPSWFSNIYIAVRFGWDIVARPIADLAGGFLPVHWESHGVGAGAIVGDTYQQAFEKGSTAFGLPLAADVAVPSESIPLQAGDAGAYGDLIGRGTVGDNLTAHHMPQQALGFTSPEEGGALVLPQGEHYMTRTYGYNGVVTAGEDSALSFRQVLAKDMQDMRNIAQQAHGSSSYYNRGLENLLGYYRNHFNLLLEK